MVDAVRRETAEPVLTLGPVVGWRTWQVTPRLPMEPGPHALLRGRRGVAWPARRLRAVCLEDAGGQRRLLAQRPVPNELRAASPTGAAPPHDAVPALGCHCGIHAHKRARTRAGWSGPTVPIAGGWAELSGTVIEGSLGYRAEQAELIGPLEIAVPCAGPSGSRVGACSAAAVAVVRVGLGSYGGTCGRPGHRRTSSWPCLTVEDWLQNVIVALADRYQASVLTFDPSNEEDDYGHR